MTMHHYKLKVQPVGDCEVIFLIESQSLRLSGRWALEPAMFLQNL
jgi:hypothetical protein